MVGARRDVGVRRTPLHAAGATEAEVRALRERRLRHGLVPDQDRGLVRLRELRRRTGRQRMARCQHGQVRGARITLPTINHEFLDRIGGFEDESDLEEAVRKELDRQNDYHQMQETRSQITEKLTEGTDWELPPDLVRRQARRELERTVLELRSSGFSDDLIQAHANTLQQNSLQSTRKALTEHFILERIAEDHEIDAEPEDFDQEVTLIAYQSGETVRRVRARLEKRGQMDALRNQIIERKVIDLICEKAKFTDETAKESSEEQDTSAINVVLSGEGEAEIPDAQHGESEQLNEPKDYT